mmetsp:Transcript_7221/g.15445  ORF Transcript_7221/g.15445 Transcript_7221/m.15445 type:complete len:376 (-) Transcript_7221:1019-2146(-)
MRDRDVEVAVCGGERGNKISKGAESWRTGRAHKESFELCVPERGRSPRQRENRSACPAIGSAWLGKLQCDRDGGFRCGLGLYKNDRRWCAILGPHGAHFAAGACHPGAVQRRSRSKRGVHIRLGLTNRSRESFADTLLRDISCTAGVLQGGILCPTIHVVQGGGSQGLHIVPLDLVKSKGDLVGRQQVCCGVDQLVIGLQDPVDAQTGLAGILSCGSAISGARLIQRESHGDLCLRRPTHLHVGPRRMTFVQQRQNSNGLRVFGDLGRRRRPGRLRGNWNVDCSTYGCHQLLLLGCIWNAGNHKLLIDPDHGRGDDHGSGSTADQRCNGSVGPRSGTGDGQSGGAVWHSDSSASDCPHLINLESDLNGIEGRRIG